MDNFLSLNCPSCGASITVTEDAARFKCEYCGTEHLLRDPAVLAVQARSALRPRVPVPPSVTIHREGQAARIVQRWFSLKYVPLAFFCVAWDSFLIFWYSMAFSGNAPWIMIVFPIAHLAVGIGLTYSTLAGFFNRTTLEVTRDEMSIFFDPLPWGGEKTIKTADLKQLFCKEMVTRGEHGNTYKYELYAVQKDNRQVKLLSNLEFGGYRPVLRAADRGLAEHLGQAGGGGIESG